MECEILCSTHPPKWVLGGGGSRQDVGGVGREVAFEWVIARAPARTRTRKPHPYSPAAFWAPDSGIWAVRGVKRITGVKGTRGPESPGGGPKRGGHQERPP